MIERCFDLVSNSVLSVFFLFNKLDPVFGVTSLALTIFLFYSTTRFIIRPFLQSGSDLASKHLGSSSKSNSKE